MCSTFRIWIWFSTIKNPVSWPFGLLGGQYLCFHSAMPVFAIAQASRYQARTISVTTSPRVTSARSYNDPDPSQIDLGLSLTCGFFFWLLFRCAAKLQTVTGRKEKRKHLLQVFTGRMRMVSNWISENKHYSFGRGKRHISDCRQPFLY